MTNQAYPSLNDVEPSWADIACTFTVYGGSLIDMADFAAIKFDSKVEVGEKRGASGGRVMARTTGSVKHTASADLYRGGHRRLGLRHSDPAHTIRRVGDLPDQARRLPSARPFLGHEGRQRR